MGQSLNCFAKTTSSVNYGKEALDDGMGDNEEKTSSSSLTLAGDLSEFPDEFKGLTYHRTEDPLSDRSEGNDGYKATFYSNKEEDKHILVHDRFIGFELGNGTIRRCLAKHVMGKTMKVEGDKLVVVDAQPVEDPKEVKGANTGWRSSNGGIKF